MKIATEKGKRNPTPRQRKLAQLIVENSRTHKAKTSKELVLQAGYPVAKANQPSVITKSPGFQQALAELGLTKELVVPMLVDDLNNNPGKRWLGLSIAGKWLNLEQKPDVNNQPMSIQNAVILIQQPDNGSTKPLQDHN